MTRTSTDAFGPNEDFYIIIDAGHGGEDGGALSDSGIVEKDLNLDIALKLEKFLTLSDYNCLLTRNSDRLMYDAGQESHKKASDITNRIKISNAYTNSIFISIHQNKFPIKKYSGLQVYYSKNHENSAVLGNLIQQNTKNLLQQENNRQIKKADKNIRVLDSIKTPAVLVECGFLSNDREAELLNDEGYRNKIAYLIYCSVIQYLDEKGMEIQIEK
jgi:N-acetylmuramoyl-L-alanine amidase